MSDESPPVPRLDSERLLTSAEFNALAEVPPEVEWFANIRNPNTRRAYRIDLREFRRFVKGSTHSMVRFWETVRPTGGISKTKRTLNEA